LHDIDFINVFGKVVQGKQIIYVRKLDYMFM